MASSMIHIAVASEVNKKLKRDSGKLFIGAIAPDISKLVGEPKTYSHFQEDDIDEIPNMDKFLEKYKNHLDDDFVMGYFIHLYTDYFWFKYFITQIYDEKTITKLDGSKFKVTPALYKQYVYNDYTNMNIKIIDEYDLDLSIFYNDIPKLDNIITEIPMDRINLIVEKSGLIVKNTKVRKDFVFDISNVKQFIKVSTEFILAEIERIENEL